MMVKYNEWRSHERARVWKTTFADFFLLLTLPLHTPKQGLGTRGPPHFGHPTDDSYRPNRRWWMIRLRRALENFSSVNWNGALGSVFFASLAREDCGACELFTPERLSARENFTGNN